MDPERILLHGNAKPRRRSGGGAGGRGSAYVVDSLDELDRLERLANRPQGPAAARQPVGSARQRTRWGETGLRRLQVRPAVRAAPRGSRYRLALATLSRVCSHIGSQILGWEPFERPCVCGTQLTDLPLADADLQTRVRGLAAPQPPSPSPRAWLVMLTARSPAARRADHRRSRVADRGRARDGHRLGSGRPSSGRGGTVAWRTTWSACTHGRHSLRLCSTTAAFHHLRCRRPTLRELATGSCRTRSWLPLGAGFCPDDRRARSPALANNYNGACRAANRRAVRRACASSPNGVTPSRTGRLATARSSWRSQSRAGSRHGGHDSRGGRAGRCLAAWRQAGLRTRQRLLRGAPRQRAARELGYVPRRPLASGNTHAVGGGDRRHREPVLRRRARVQRRNRRSGNDRAARQFR